MGQARNRIHVLPPSDGANEPTVGTIKSALHGLSQAPSGAAPRDYARALSEVHDLMRRLARLNGIDPDEAVRGRRAAVQSQRERMVVTGDTAQKQTSN